MREAIYLETITALQAGQLRRVAFNEEVRDDADLPCDRDARTRHFGVYVGDRLAGVASVYPEAPPGESDGNAWRVRGITTEPAYRGAGLGALLVRACINHASSHGGQRVWCTPLSAAVDFLARQGFRRHRTSQPAEPDRSCLMQLAL